MSSQKKKSRAPKQRPLEAPAENSAAAQPQVQIKMSEVSAPATPTPDVPQAQAVALSRKVLAWRPSLQTLLLLGILAVGLVFRLLPATYMIRDGYVMFAEFDPYYHMRRILFTVQNFPLTNVFDAYVNYPSGYYVGWPPLLDVLGATLSLIAGLGHPGQYTVELVCAALPVGLGLLAIVAAYVFTRDVFNEKAALLAAFVMAILPASIFRASFGYVDHHVLEVLLSLTMYVLFLRAATRAKAQGLSFGNLLQHRGPLAYAALTGVATAAMVFTWDGAPLFVATILLYSLLQYTVDAWRKESSEYLSVVGLVAAAVMFILVVPVALTSYHGLRLEISAIYLSLFHAIFAAGLVGFFLCMEGLRLAVARIRAPWVALPAGILALGAVAVLLVKTLMPSVFANLEGGLTFLGSGSLVLSSISETAPLLTYGGQFSVVLVTAFLSTATILAILGCGFFLYSLLETRPGNGQIFFLIWSLVVISLGLMQSRFIYLLGACVAIYAGYGMYRLLSLAGLDTLLEQIGKAGPKGPAKTPLRVPPVLLVIAVVLVLVLVPVAQASYARYTTPEVYTIDWNEAAQWLKDNTPATSYAYSTNMSAKPEYSVMTWWDSGNFVLYRAERPAVANNFQTGVETSSHFYMSQNETAANPLMDTHNSRYVTVDRRMTANTLGVYYGIFENMATVGGYDVYQYFTYYKMPKPYGSVIDYEGNELYYGTMFSRLWYGWGCGGMTPIGGLQNGLEHYRLEYVTHGSDPVLIFEYVKGATITGTAPPGARVELQLNVTEGDNTRTYTSVTQADESGAYHFTVPYSTGSTGDVRTASDYTITSGTTTVKAQVPEDAVAEGRTITAGGM